MNLSKRDILIFAAFTIIFGLMTGFGIGQYKNTRFEMMITDLEKTKIEYAVLNKSLIALNNSLNGEIKNNMNQIMERNSLEVACTNRYYTPNSFKNSFKRQAQIMLFSRMFNYNLTKFDNGTIMTGASIERVTHSIYDLDSFITPPQDRTDKPEFDVCWIAHANNTVV